MKKTPIIASVLALAAVPAAATAHPGNGQGGEHALGKGRVHDGVHGRCARLQRVAFVARGSLVSFTPTALTTDGPNVGDLVLKVTRANHHAAKYTSATPLSTADARVKFHGVTDGNADNAVGFDDVLATDRVMVIGKLLRPKRGCTGDTSVVLRKVTVKRPDAAADQQPETKT